MPSFSSARQDTNAAVNGIWVSYATPDGPIKFLVAKNNNKEYAAFVAKELEPYQLAFQAKSMEDAIAQRIVIQARARFILRGWENVTDDEGNPVPYSVEAAEELFADEALQPLHVFIMETANAQQLYSERVQQQLAKNS